MQNGAEGATLAYLKGIEAFHQGVLLAKLKNDFDDTAPRGSSLKVLDVQLSQSVQLNTHIQISNIKQTLPLSSTQNL